MDFSDRGEDGFHTVRCVRRYLEVVVPRRFCRSEGVPRTRRTKSSCACDCGMGPSVGAFFFLLLLLSFFFLSSLTQIRAKKKICARKRDFLGGRERREGGLYKRKQLFKSWVCDLKFDFKIIDFLCFLTFFSFFHVCDFFPRKGSRGFIPAWQLTKVKTQERFS